MSGPSPKGGQEGSPSTPGGDVEGQNSLNVSSISPSSNQPEPINNVDTNNSENQPLDSTNRQQQPKQRSSSQQDSETIEYGSGIQQKRPLDTATTTNTTRRAKHHQLKEIKHHRKQQHPNTEPSLSLTAADYKNAGNNLCQKHRYEDAISNYTKAISKNPEVAIFFSNRALCYLKLQQFTQAVQDCRRALELDPNLIKAHFFLGQALAESTNFDDALKHLQRAHELAREKKMNFGDDIAYQIRLTKRRRWNKIEEDSAHLENELQSYLVQLIKKDKEAKLEELKERLKSEASGSLEWQRTASSSSLQITPGTSTSPDPAHFKSQESEILSKCDKYIDKLETMFNNLKLQRKRREVPDYLCGKISFEIMHDPVITPSGITYDRQDIEEHLKRVGHFDPITRQSLQANQLISNISMKEVVDSYLNENEWALYH